MLQENFENRRFFCLEVCEALAASTPRKSSAAAERHRKGEGGSEVKTRHEFCNVLDLSIRALILAQNIERCRVTFLGRT
jgi:hypothetical protein